MLFSLAFSVWEIWLSVEAVNLQLSDIEVEYRS